MFVKKHLQNKLFKCRINVIENSTVLEVDSEIQKRGATSTRREFDIVLSIS